MDGKDFDGFEPVERLPKLTLGEYDLTIDNTAHNEGYKGEFFVIEVTVDESKGDGAVAKGTRAAHLIKLDVTKKAQPFMVKRVKSFVYPALGRRNIDGEELVDLMKSEPSVFAGKKIKAKVKAATDSEGNEKLNPETGEAYTEIEFSA